METRHVSAYYTRRCGRHRGHYKHRYPKLSAVCDTRTHLILSAFVNRGPKPDHVEFADTLVAAAKRQRIEMLVGDAGYESEAAHRFCRHALGIVSVFPTTQRGRPRLDGKAKTVTGRYRREMLNHFPKKPYGQRWQIETTFSMLKRLLGSAVRGRKRYAIDREIVLRVLTINLMIVLHLLSCFQQSMTVPYFPELAEGVEGPAATAAVTMRRRRPRPLFRTGGGLRRSTATHRGCARTPAGPAADPSIRR